MNKEPKSMIDEMFYKKLKLGTCPSCAATIVIDLDSSHSHFYCQRCGVYLQVGNVKGADE